MTPLAARAPRRVRWVQRHATGDGPLLCGHLSRVKLQRLARRYRLRLVRVPSGQSIPGSYWGESEAGLVNDRLCVRDDTPVHSLLHELSHYVCMHPLRRRGLHTDAGGDDLEECAVCWLQLALAVEMGLDLSAIARDMDRWGYSFRQGSVVAWLEGDACDARRWLVRHRVLDGRGRPTGRGR